MISNRDLAEVEAEDWEGGWMVGWWLISLVTTSNYQLEAGDREGRVTLCLEILSVSGGDGKQAVPSHNGARARHEHFITISWALLLLAFVSVGLMFLL